MADPIATATVELHATLDKLDEEVKRALDGVDKQFKDTGEKAEGELANVEDSGKKHFGGFKDNALGVFAAVGGALAAIGVGKFVADSVAAATDSAAGFRELQSVIEATGGAAGLTADQVADIASSLSVKIGVDDDDIIKAQDVLLTFKNIGGSSLEDVTGLAADMAAVFGGDLSSSATQLGKALNDPTAGISALSRVGVTFTEEQQAQIKAMQEAGDIAGAQGIVMEELRGQVGGAAEASATGAQKMKVAFGELQESLGGGIAGALEGIAPVVVGLLDSLQPALATLGDTLGQALDPLVESLGPVIGTLVDTLAPVLVDVGGLFADLAPLAEPLVKIIGVLVKALSGPLSKAIDALSPAIVLIAGFLGDMADVIGGVLLSAVDALTPVIQVVADLFNTALAAVLPIVTEVVQRLADVIGPLVPLVGDALTRVLTALAPILPPLADALLQVVNALIPLLGAVLPLLPPLLELVTLFVEKIGAPILIALADAIGLLAGAFGTLAGIVVGVIATVVQTVVGWIDGFGEIPGKVGDIIGEVGAFFTGLPGIISAAIDSAVEFIAGLPGRAVDALATLASDIGDTVQGAVDGAYDAVTGFVDDSVSFITGLPGKAVSALATFGSSIVDTLTTAATSITDEVSALIDDVVQFFTDLPGDIVDELVDLGTDVAGAFTDAVTTVTDAASGMVDDVLQFFTDLPGNILDTLGDIGTTIASGLFDAFKGAWNSIVDFLPTFSIPIPFVDDPTVDIGSFLRLADGITRTPGAMFAQIGEAGAESVIPLTRPGRAFEIMDDNGLGALWDRMTGRGGGGITIADGGSIVSMPGAIIQDATDVDRVAQRTMAAVTAKALAAA